MDTARNRRRFVIVAIVIWAMMIALVFFVVPPQPRLTFVVTEPFDVIGITADGKTLVTAEQFVAPGLRAKSGVVQIWDLNEGGHQSFCVLDKHQLRPSKKALEDSETVHYAGSMTLAPGGQALAYHVYQGTFEMESLRLWSFSSNREVLCLTSSSLQYDRFSPDGNWFAAIDDGTGPHRQDGSITIYNSSTGELVLRKSAVAPFVNIREFCFALDGRHIAFTAGTLGRGHTQVWDLKDRRQISAFEGWYYYLALSPDGETLAGVDLARRGKTQGSLENAPVKLVDVGTGKVRFELRGHGDLYTALAFARDGHTITAYNYQGANHPSLQRATTWDAATGELLRSFVPAVPRRGTFDLNDGTPPIIAQPEEPLWRIFDAVKGVQLATVPINCYPARVSADDRILVTQERHEEPEGFIHWVNENIPGLRALWNGPATLRLWDLHSGEKIAKLGNKGSKFRVMHDSKSKFRFTADSKTLITGIGADRIEVWDVPLGWPIKTILAWSLPLPLFVLLVGEWRLRRRRKRQLPSAAA